MMQYRYIKNLNLLSNFLLYVNVEGKKETIDRLSVPVSFAIYV